MSHVRQQIRDRMIVTLKAGVPLVGSRVYNTRFYEVREASLPCLVVYSLNEAENMISMDGTLERTLNLMVSTYVSGTSDTVQDDLDDVIAEIETAVGGDYTLNNLAHHAELVATAIEPIATGEN